MNLILTDVLDCPACMAGGGLILLADRVEGRRIFEGQLGCPQCRRRYPVREAVADFTDGASSAPTAAEEPGEPVELAAMLGVTEPPATILLVGAYERAAAGIAAMLPDVQVVVAHEAASHWDGDPGTSVLRVGDRLPIRDRAMRGVIVANRAQPLLPESMRVCGLASRVVSYAGAVEAGGFRVVAQDTGRVVAVRVS